MKKTFSIFLICILCFIFSSCSDYTDTFEYQKGFEDGYDFANEDLEPEIDAAVEALYDACQRYDCKNVSMSRTDIKKIGKYSFFFDIAKSQELYDYFLVKFSVDGFDINTSLKKEMYSDGSGYWYNMLNEENDNIFSCMFFINDKGELKGYHDHIFDKWYIDEDEKIDLIQDGFISNNLHKYNEDDGITTAILYLDISGTFYRISIPYNK